MIQLPENTTTIRCIQCKCPALGIYTWDTKSFGNISTHTAILCGSCGIEKSNERRAYLDKHSDEMRFYRPNSNVRILESFNYHSPTRPMISLNPVRDSKTRTTRELSVTIMMNQAALDSHNPNLMDNYKPRKVRK